MSYPLTSHCKKREIQRTIYPLVKEEVVYGLGGPFVDEWASLFINVRKIFSYENNREIYNKQVEESIDPRITLRFGTIYNAPIRKKGFYDMDLMCTPNTCQDLIYKYKDVTSILYTFVNGRAKNRLEAFFEASEEIVLDRYKIQNHSITGAITECRIVTDKNRWFYKTYKDDCPMFILYKIPKEFYATNYAIY